MTEILEGGVPVIDFGEIDLNEWNRAGSYVDDFFYGWDGEPHVILAAVMARIEDIIDGSGETVN